MGRHRAQRPATFREVFANSEFRAIYTASTLSWAGDYLARAAVTALVYQSTDSVMASAAAFATSYAPWLLGGSVLVSLAERYPYRTAMIISDSTRMVLMALIAIPGTPVPTMFVLLLLTSVLAPPFEAARSATLPSILPGDRYVVGLAALSTAAQPTQVVGYFIGAALATHQPRLALLVNAVTFAVSAIVIAVGVRARQPALDAARRSHLLRETAEGFRLVFGNPALRAVALVVFGSALFVVLPEGLAAAWASDTAGGIGQGWAQGAIMAAVPLGWIVGALVVGRLASPATRMKLIRPLAMCVPLALAPAVLAPSTLIVAALALLCGFATGALIPAANGLFVQALPNAFRARAFGVVQAGLQLVQGSAVLVTGGLSQRTALPRVVGGWSLCGVILMGVIVWMVWPTPRTFEQARDAAKAANASPAEADARPAHAIRSDDAAPRDAPVDRVVPNPRQCTTPTAPGKIDQ